MMTDATFTKLMDEQRPFVLTTLPGSLPLFHLEVYRLEIKNGTIEQCGIDELDARFGEHTIERLDLEIEKAKAYREKVTSTAHSQG